jgi:hypothetical protein
LRQDQQQLIALTARHWMKLKKSNLAANTQLCQMHLSF